MFLILIVSININFSWITNKKKIQHLHPFIYSSLFPPRIHLRHRPEEATMLLNDSNKVITSDTELLRTIKDSFQESKCLIVLSGRHLFLEYSQGTENSQRTCMEWTGVYWLFMNCRMSIWTSMNFFVLRPPDGYSRLLQLELLLLW